MHKVAGGLKDVVDHLEAKGVLSASDTKAIIDALEHLKADPAPPPPVEKALSGSYWEGRSRALHDRKFHP